MGITFGFNVFGTKQIFAKLSRFGKGISDFRKAWIAMADDFYRTERKLFATEGTSGEHGRWKPLSSAYAEWKSFHFSGQPILVQFGNLRSSLLTGTHVDSVREIQKNFMRVGTKDPKAFWHFKGSGNCLLEGLLI